VSEAADLYAAARRKAQAAQGRRPADPQTPRSPGRPVTLRRTLCICGDFGPCRCAPATLAQAIPGPERYEYERAVAFYLRHPPQEV